MTVRYKIGMQKSTSVKKIKFLEERIYEKQVLTCPGPDSFAWYVRPVLIFLRLLSFSVLLKMNMILTESQMNVGMKWFLHVFGSKLIVNNNSL